MEAVLDMAITTVSSLSESFVSGGPVVAEETAAAAATTTTTDATLENEKQPSLPIEDKEMAQDDAGGAVQGED